MGLSLGMQDYKVEYRTDMGNGAYIVVSATGVAEAKRKDSIILNRGEKITSLTVGIPSYYR